MYCSVHECFGLCSVILGICVRDTTIEIYKYLYVQGDFCHEKCVLI